MNERERYASICIRRRRRNNKTNGIRSAKYFLQYSSIIDKNSLSLDLHEIRQTAGKLSGKHLDDTVAARTDHESSVAAPADVADTFAPHGPVRYDILCADSLLKGPETDAGVVPGGDGFAAVLGEAERRDGGGVGEHGVSALACGEC